MYLTLLTCISCLQPRLFTISDHHRNTGLSTSPSAQRRSGVDIMDMTLFDGVNSANHSNANEESTNQSEEENPRTKKNFAYYFRHPYFRIATSYLVVFCNFLIFAEDPVSHSYTDCIIDIIGNMYGFVFAR